VALASQPAISEAEVQLVKVLATGKAQSMLVLRDWILVEPSVEGIVVPTREWGTVTAQEITRLMRIYFPRTFQDLVVYDFLFLAQVDMSFITPEQAQWMHDGIADRGLGAVNTRSVMSMNIWLSEPWASSVLSQAFPNDAMAVIRSPYYLKPSGPLVVNDDEMIAPVMRPFKGAIESTFPAYSGLLTIPREGSRIHSWLRTGLLDQAYPLPGFVPHLMEWDYQSGITFTMMDMVYDTFWMTSINPFALDVVVNMIWHGAHRELPEDALKVHILRDRLSRYSSERSAVMSVFDFAEIFGANTIDLYRELGVVQSQKGEVDRLYLEGDFDGSYALIEAVTKSLEGLAEEALRLKDQAMAWVYLLEWLTVTGTSLFCGAGLWILMVRRGLYREAGVTRMQDKSKGRDTY